MRRAPRTVLALTLLVAACGDGNGDGAEGSNGSASIDSPCDLASSEMVEAAFAGSAGDGVEGTARNCKFEIESGVSDSVDVFYFGTDDGWDGTKSGYDDNRGGTTEVPDLGDDAYYPGDAGAGELVVRAGGHIFAVASSTFFADPAAVDSIEMAVFELANSIADGLK